MATRWRPPLSQWQPQATWEGRLRAIFCPPHKLLCLVNALIHTTVKIWTVKAESDLDLWSQPLILQMTTRSSGSQEVPKVTEQAEPPSPDRWA